MLRSLNYLWFLFLTVPVVVVVGVGKEVLLRLTQSIWKRARTELGKRMKCPKTEHKDEIKYDVYFVSSTINL